MRDTLRKYICLLQDFSEPLIGRYLRVSPDVYSKIRIRIELACLGSDFWKLEEVRTINEGGINEHVSPCGQGGWAHWWALGDSVEQASELSQPTDKEGVALSPYCCPALLNVCFQGQYSQLALQATTCISRAQRKRKQINQWAPRARATSADSRVCRIYGQSMDTVSYKKVMYFVRL